MLGGLVQNGPVTLIEGSGFQFPAVTIHMSPRQMLHPTYEYSKIFTQTSFKSMFLIHLWRVSFIFFWIEYIIMKRISLNFMIVTKIDIPFTAVCKTLQ